MLKRHAAFLAAVVVALSCALTSPARAAEGEGEPVLELRESFAEVPNGPAPDTLVGSEHEVTNFQVHPEAAPHVREGFLTTASPAGATAGSYRIARLDAEVTTVGAEFAFTPHSAQGGVLCLSIQTTSIATTEPVPASPLHLVVTPTGWRVDVNTRAGTQVDTMVDGAFAEPLVADGRTLHAVEVAIDRERARMRLTLPDGSTRTFAHPSFAIPGQYVYVEPFKSPAAGPIDQQADALVREWWAGTEAVTLLEGGEALADPAGDVPPEPVATTPPPAPVPEPVVSQLIVAPPAVAAAEAPRSVRATRHGERVVVTWRAAEVRSTVQCGLTSRTVPSRRAILRSRASHCKVRSIIAGDASPWVRVRVQRIDRWGRGRDPLP